MKKALLVGLLMILTMAGCSKPGRSGAEGAGAAIVGPFDTSYGAFKSAFGAKDYGKALNELRSLMWSFWGECPLVLENVKFVKSANNSYGIYEPKESDVFASSEPIYLYMEPAGYGVVRNPAGYYEFGFRADFQVADENGKVLGGQTDFAVMPFKSWNFNTEISLSFTYTLSGLARGKYKVITQVSDANSAKKATAEKWFTIE